jgi:membrane protein DedA with SNARE-associated domain
MAEASEPSPTASTDAADVRPRPSRRQVAALAVPLLVLVVCNYVGDALAPTLVDTHPAWLLALNARNRNLALVTNSLDAWTYYGIGTVRLLAADPLFFLLGYWYGDAAVTWMERRTTTWGQLLRQLEQWFGKAAYPLIFIAPNNFICLFAGAAGMPLRAFFAVNIAGTITRLWLIRLVGKAFESPLDDLVGWIGDHRVPLLVASVALVVVSIALEARRGESEVGSLVRLDDELEEAADELERRRSEGDDEDDRRSEGDDEDDRRPEDSDEDDEPPKDDTSSG